MPIMKPTLRPAKKPGSITRPAAKPVVRALQYTEEYDIAEPLIASVLWGRPTERQQALVQLNSVNDQIQAKNVRYKTPKAKGCIDIAAFKTAAEQLGQASTAFAKSKDTTLFSHAQSDLNEYIRLGKLPKSWNIEWEEFLDFHLERVGRSNTQGNQHKSSLNTQSDPSGEVEDEYDDGDMQAGYDEDSGANDDEEGGYYEEGNEYSDKEDEYDDEEEEEEEGEYDDYAHEENEYDQGGDGYDEEGDEYDDTENGFGQDAIDHDIFDDGPELVYSTERELECVDIGLVRRRAQNHYGLLLASGSILGWRKTKLEGLVAVMGYECQGKRTARVKQHKDHDDEQESVMKDRSSSKILGIGLIAWEVDSKSVFEPTKPLYPTPNGTYPATFIAVRWEGDIWTWESREDFYSFMEDLGQFEVDIILYYMAISQEGGYIKAMTGKRPKFPVPGLEIAPEGSIG